MFSCEVRLQVIPHTNSPPRAQRERGSGKIKLLEALYLPYVIYYLPHPPGMVS